MILNGNIFKDIPNNNDQINRMEYLKNYRIRIDSIEFRTSSDFFILGGRSMSISLVESV